MTTTPRAFLTFLTVSGIAALTPSIHAAPEPGSVKAHRVTGNVQLKDDASGASEALAAGRVFGQGSTVITAADSTAVLHFSNGSSVVVEPDSQLEVKQFVQEPHSSKRTYVSLRADPSASRTKLQLHVGAVVAQTKKLHVGSTYEIDTAVGSAGIRGSSARVEYDPSSQTMKIGNVEGDVEATPWVVDAGNIVLGQAQEWQGVNDDTQIEITVNTDPLGRITVQVITNVPFTAAQVSRIQAAIRQLVPAIETTGTTVESSPTIEVDVDIVSPSTADRRSN